MKKKLPKISVIIPVKPEEKMIKALESLKEVDYSANLVEIFISYGFNPSRQRNEGVKRAKGEILYFLDNDSELERQAFKKTINAFSGRMTSVKLPYARGFSLLPGWFSDLIVEILFSRAIYKGEIGVVGGPNIWDKEESFWYSMAGIIFESFFASLKMSSRWRPIGGCRRVDEKELILCNLAVRRDVFKKAGGFNEALYPNEENELLYRIDRLGYQLVYHPGILVFRPRRESFKKILSTFFHYGRGRMENVKVAGFLPSLPLFLPLALLGYLFGFIFFHPWFAFLPLILYFGMGFGSALGFATRRKKPYLAVFLPPLFLIAHLTYALGLLYGLATDLEGKKRYGRKRKIGVVKIKSFEKGWDILV
ncbi:MAG: glycosyltransferase [Candidatus Marinimicrobia bacterium]|nr:glycosyltransferase [Candidatus Neomarinimicrobiota bacterium]